MKLKIYHLFFIILSTLSYNLYSQNSNKCATMSILGERILKDPSLHMKMEQSEIKTQNWINTHPGKQRQVITIPVVVHIIYHDQVENVSDAQVQSQIDVLNLDFRKLNPDTLSSSHPFWQFTADPEIEFCLASQDPAGNPTTGITRTYTDTLAFSGDGREKQASSGGVNNWDPTNYLNLWVCNLNGSNGTLGYAAFPADLATNPGEDGVVIRYEAFGNIGTAGTGGFNVNNGGRTATHEVGHWLNLRHIWGDSPCGDDFVADTKVAEGDNYNCPTFPHRPNNACGGDADGEMYMNYMDYVDDNCMNMFTAGQVQRMQAALNTERIGLLTSTAGCSPHIGVDEISWGNGIGIYPNPSNGYFMIDAPFLNSEKLTVTVYDLPGKQIQKFENINLPYSVQPGKLSQGVYYLKINNGNYSVTKKVFVTK